jgi:hypothetical protein
LRRKPESVSQQLADTLNNEKNIQYSIHRD